MTYCLLETKNKWSKDNLAGCADPLEPGNEKLKGMCKRVTKDMKRDSWKVMKNSRHFGVGERGANGSLWDAYSETFRVAFIPAVPS